MPSSLIFGLNDADFVILGINDYDYSNNTTVMNLLNTYKKVQFDNQFNSEISWLPEGITDINLGMNFNKPLENLPSTVKRIKIAKYNEIGYSSFNQPLDNLPNGLEEFKIHFGLLFNQSLDNLPPTLKKINIVSTVFDYPINNLPSNLEYIKLCKFDYNNTISLPSQLKQIHILEYKSNVENLDKPEYNGLRELKNNYPHVEFIYKV